MINCEICISLSREDLAIVIYYLTYFSLKFAFIKEKKFFKMLELEI